MENTLKPYSLFREKESGKWTLRISHPLQSAIGIVPHSRYVLNFRKQKKTWLRLESLIDYIQANFPDFIELTLIFPNGFTLTTHAKE